MGTAIKHPVPDRVKSSFVTFDIRAQSECPDVKNYKWQLNPVWHRMLYSCTHMTTVGVKGLKRQSTLGKSKTTQWTETSDPINSLVSMTNCWSQRDLAENLEISQAILMKTNAHHCRDVNNKLKVVLYEFRAFKHKNCFLCTSTNWLGTWLVVCSIKPKWNFTINSLYISNSVRKIHPRKALWEHQQRHGKHTDCWRNTRRPGL